MAIARQQVGNGPPPADLAALLFRMRVMAGLTQNQFAQMSGVDPAYVNQLEHGKRSTPSRETVLRFWNTSGLSTVWRERLLVAAGYCPEVIIKAGGWDAYLDRITGALQED